MSQRDAQTGNSRERYTGPLLNRPPGSGGFGGRNRGTPVVKPKHFQQTIRRLWFYLRRERNALITVFLLILTDALLVLAGPYLIGQAIDAMGPAGLNTLKRLLLLLAFVYVSDAGLTFLQGWIMAGVSQRIVKLLRDTLFQKLQKLPLAFFDTRPHGELMSRLSNDIDNINNAVSQSAAQLMSGVIAIAGSLAMMLYLSPLLTAAALITVPLVFLLGRTITRRTGVLFKEQQAQLGKLNGQVEETISGIEVIQAFNHEEQVIAEFERLNRELCKVGLQAQIWSGFLMPIMNVINNIGLAAIALAGGILAVKGLITVGVIASFISYSRQFVRPLNDMANIYNILQSGVAGAERVFEILDAEEEPADLPGATDLENPRGEITFENVSFGYRPDVSTLRQVSFKASQGSSTALVGPTGAGKTTIVNLLTRFYDVTGGRILLDGRDIRTYTRDSLRRCFGVVLQDTYLFSGTIRENITYGNPDATGEEMEEAAAMANAAGFIKRLPNQYDTILSENGGMLSQGQKQLLAIARVILAKPAILILDEATSSIDTRTELGIQEALSRIMQGHTSFIIAHRLNTIRDADTILVIDHGEIVEQGPHAALLAQQGIYSRMFANQRTT